MYVYSGTIYLLVQVYMCNSIRIVNLYPYEKEHYQLDYSAFFFCFQSCKLYSFPKLLKLGILVRWFHTFVIKLGCLVKFCIPFLMSKCFFFLICIHWFTFCAFDKYIVSCIYHNIIHNNITALNNPLCLDKEMATHSTILPWEIPGTEEPGRLQSMGSQRVRRNLVTEHNHFFLISNEVLKINLFILIGG